ncbi:hypothetical protein EYF80_048689 [Liparis tanakae]|uniref:Uncharacterized protein n=1 Tax=Liparis tanakae TaxID=230148 RepID=A0A4Z2FIW4_9TELE|nr:hypothetical protein EYF80_048689 [Liparis tanakae]
MPADDLAPGCYVKPPKNRDVRLAAVAGKLARLHDARWAHISSGLMADGGSARNHPDAYGGGPLGLHGRTAKNDNDRSSSTSSGILHALVSRL